MCPSEDGYDRCKLTFPSLGNRTPSRCNPGRIGPVEGTCFNPVRVDIPQAIRETRLVWNFLNLLASVTANILVGPDVPGPDPDLSALDRLAIISEVRQRVRPGQFFSVLGKTYRLSEQGVVQDRAPCS
jgi:hypothetical protein